MHEKFSASRAARHMGCVGSANLPTAIPNWVDPEIDPTADNAANRGTEMHRMFAEVMSLPSKDALYMAQALEYVTDIRRTRRFKVLSEVLAAATWLVSIPPTTADLVLYVQDEMHIFDLKTGKIPVDAMENEQMLFYAATYGPLAPKASGVHLHIVQPWANNTHSWFASAARIHQFMLDAKAAEQQILATNTSLTPGDWCKFCPANPHGRGAKGRPYCPAMMDLLYPSVGMDEAAMLGE